MFTMLRIQEIYYINKNLDIEINQLRITLEPFKLRIKAKTLGPNLKYKDKVLGIESVTTQIPLNSFIDDNKNFILIRHHKKFREKKSISINQHKPHKHHNTYHKKKVISLTS